MVKWFLIGLSVGLYFPLSAQMFDNRNCNVWSESNQWFNPRFLRANKIKSMHGVLSTKAEMDLVRKGYLEYIYHFDTAGRLVTQCSITKSNKGTDTALIFYMYNDRGNLSILRKNDVSGFFSYQYEYDSSGNVCKESYYRDQNIGSSGFGFKPGKQFNITSETFTYDSINARESRKHFFNPYNKPYMELTTVRNSLGLKVQEEYRYMFSNKRRVLTYEYDEKGRVARFTDFSTVGGKNKSEHHYQYDQVGNPIKEKVFRNNQHIKTLTYLYDERMLLNATVEKDVATMLITIIQYSYTFYNEPVSESGQLNSRRQ